MISCELASFSVAIVSSVMEHRPALISPMCSSTCSTRRCSAELTATRLQGVLDRGMERERSKSDCESRQLRDGAHDDVVGAQNQTHVLEAWVEALHPVLQPLANFGAGALHAAEIHDVGETIETGRQLFEMSEE